MAAYPKKGLKTKARLGFLDESAFSDKPMIRRTWALKGRTPIIKVPGCWVTRSVISMITCSPKGIHPHLYFRTVKGAVNQDVFIRFLKNIRRHVRGRLILIMDNLRVHKSRKVIAYLKTQKQWLCVEFLPSYAQRTQSCGISLVEREAEILQQCLNQRRECS